MSWLKLATCGFKLAPVRGFLTWLSIVTAFALFGVLEGVDQSFDNTLARFESFSNRLFAVSKVSRGDQLPLAYLSRLERLPGIEIATPSTSFRSYFQHSGNWIGGYAVDPMRHFSVYREYDLAPDQLRQMQQIRTAAVIGRGLAEKYGWKIGSRIPLHSFWRQVDGSPSWSFDVVGIYDTADSSDNANLFINYEYFDAARAASKGTVTHLIVRVAPGVNTQRISSQIDALFANSSDETLTQNERDLVRDKMRQMGDINLFVRTVVGGSLVVLLLLTINVMRQSVDERLAEFAALKSIGFDERQVAALVVAECCLLVISGAAVGLLAAAGIIRMLPPQLGTSALPWQTAILAAACAFALALASAIAPVLRIRNMTISKVLAGD